MSRKRSLSGIKPTGMPHLGNYLGMIRPAVDLQETHEAFYFVADLHSLTTTHDPKVMRQHTLDITAIFLAFGLDPERAVFWRQSDVPEVTELSWILSCVTSMGMLERAHAWKAAKDRGDSGGQPHGLFAYPVLMAADILLYDSDVVPVGKDQIQHVEMTRDMAEKFNRLFGDSLKLPSAKVQEEVQTIIGTDGRKMSKSYNNTIPVFLPAKKLRKAVMRIETDSKGLEDVKDPDSCNVMTLYRLFADAESIAEMEGRYRAGGYGYGHAKQALFEAMDSHLAAPRERFEALRSHEDTLEDVLREGERRAREVALPILERVRSVTGLGRPTR
ncbi:MAG: tryptophan--tRNA ligase [Deltaproteobacteria bacterium]|nr:tryptophan--tRNA ligase [Deltaproteobacteria bacterium]